MEPVVEMTLFASCYNHFLPEYHLVACSLDTRVGTEPCCLNPGRLTTLRQQCHHATDIKPIQHQLCTLLSFFSWIFKYSKHLMFQGAFVIRDHGMQKVKKGQEIDSRLPFHGQKGIAWSVNPASMGSPPFCLKSAFLLYDRRTCLPSLLAATAQAAATGIGRVAFPPKPPPTRRHTAHKASVRLIAPLCQEQHAGGKICKKIQWRALKTSYDLSSSCTRKPRKYSLSSSSSSSSLLLLSLLYHCCCSCCYYYCYCYYC